MENRLSIHRRLGCIIPITILLALFIFLSIMAFQVNWRSILSTTTKDSTMTASLFHFRGETKVLDDASRADAPGEFIELSDGMVHYQLAGPADAPTVVLVHGFSVPYYVWDPTFDGLVEAGLRVLRYDLYGRGYSDRPKVDYDADLFDRQLVELLDALDIETPVDLAGLSMGGAISVNFTARHPEMVRRLALISPAGLPIDNPLKKIVEFPVVGELVLGFGGGQLLVSSLADDFATPEAVDQYLEQYRVQMQYQGFIRALLSTLRNGVITGAESSYKAVGEQDRPVLLIWGMDDKAIPFETSDQVRRLLPQAEFHPIDSAGHISHYEKPEIVNPLLVEFFSR